jgi:hypothetical protein
MSASFDSLPLAALIAWIGVTGTLATGCSSAPEKPDQSDVAAEVEPVVDRVTWLTTIRDGLTEDLCGENEVYRSCFYISETDCHARVSEVTENCENRLHSEMPEAFNESQGKMWAGRVGSCVGDSLNETLSANYPFHETENCSKILSAM